MDENIPIIRFYFAKMKKAFMNLSEEEKMAFMRKDRENLDELGMRAVIMVDCRGENEEWDYIGVEQWTTMDASKSVNNLKMKSWKYPNMLNQRLILAHLNHLRDMAEMFELSKDIFNLIH